MREELAMWMLYISMNFRDARLSKIREVIANYDESFLIAFLELNYMMTTAHMIARTEEIIKLLSNQQIGFCTYFDLDYPKTLSELYDYPLCLYYRGNRERLKDENIVSIVGTRKPSYDGIKMCDIMAKHLSYGPYTIVSGLALGIDVLVQRQALKYNCPTIAVLASGVDEITPKSHRRIGEEIIEKGGMILSEYPPKTPSYAANYVVRNRIISGLSMKTFVIEAGLNSGSMITAKHALYQNRSVYAMPGSISNPVSEGTNRLIKDGAIPVIEPNDFVEIDSITKNEQNTFLNDDIYLIIKKLKYVDIENLMSLTKLNYMDLITKLTELEIKSLVTINMDTVRANT